MPNEPMVCKAFTLPIKLAGWLEKLAKHWDMTEGEIVAELLLPVMQYHLREETYATLTRDREQFDEEPYHPGLA